MPSQEAVDRALLKVSNINACLNELEKDYIEFGKRYYRDGDEIIASQHLNKITSMSKKFGIELQESCSMNMSPYMPHIERTNIRIRNMMLELVNLKETVKIEYDTIFERRKLFVEEQINDEKRRLYAIEMAKLKVEEEKLKIERLQKERIQLELFLEKERLEAPMRREEQRLLREKAAEDLKKAQIHKEALRRIAHKKASIEISKIEEEVLAEMARIEASM
jgi:hypothetical protein